LLPRLESVNASFNRITHIPQCNMTLRTATNFLTFIDLSHNALSKFPEDLMTFTARLDLTNNRIKTLPINLDTKVCIQGEDKLWISTWSYGNVPSSQLIVHR
jgi:Leucine-rich repeat (LRR) protein